MDKLYNKLMRYREAWFFTGLLLWAAIAYSQRQSSASWLFFLHTISALSIVLLPVIVFAWFRERIKQLLTPAQYLVCWLLFFGVALPLLTYACSQAEPAGYPGWLFIACTTSSISLELILAVNTYYRKKIVKLKWVQGFGLEKSILISIVVISVALSAMAASSLDTPYYNNGHLLIAFRFTPSKIIQYFGTFASLTVQFLLMYLAGYLFFLINSRFLVSKVLKQYGLIAYILTMLTVVAFLFPLVAQFLNALPINDLLGPIFPNNPFMAENAVAAISIILLTLPVLLSQQWTKQNSQIVSLEKEKAQAELDLLKQQINPHFLFNTLNNLYALSLQQSHKTPESILQLSELMRYVIYKGKEEKVKITDEVKYIEDFMELQQIRLRKPLQLSVEKEIEDGQQLIAPLLLIVFIENAFKHGIEPAEEKAFLHISLKTMNKQLFFSCENSFEKENEQERGIGLNNLKKRLDLLYPGKHVLKTGIKNHTFKAELQIDLS
jgi:sensor histidine kinase YesM